jgi:glycosyltransferase involved in cell wall biosynthesis
MHCEVIRQNNMGVAATRNNGIAHAQGEYILCLDADDMLGHEDMLQKLAEALDHDRGLGIVFTGLRMMAEDGTLGNNSNWPNGFDFEAQIMGRNQVPTCCMFRREAWRRAGGYKALYTPAEDAELWTRIAALGYRVSHAIPGNWFHYRLHAGSLSSTVREGRKVEPDWLHDKPWVNDRQFPLAANGIARPVRNYDRPKVTIIIPVADYHVMNLPVALDSVEQQTERSWQCIVVNDTGSELPVMVPFPWAKVIDTGGHKGAGVARNLGVKAATSNLVTFLDADDILMPTYLEKVLKAYQRTGRYVYTEK